MTTGDLLIRGSAEPAAMPSPTTISGTNTDGALTGGTLSTPAVSFERHITHPAPTTVFIDASFREVTPGSVEGSISPDGEVSLQASLRVDLEIDVEILPGQHFSCSTSPVKLTLTGTHDGSRVVLEDPDFTVPAVPITATCPDFVADGVNAQLQGSGHALSLTMAGALTPAPQPGEPSITTLVVDPAGGSTVGDAVVLDATVVADPAGEGTTVPQGVVDFKDGSAVIGSVPLTPEGTASLTTAALAAGPRSLSAVYRGSAPVYAGSHSTAQPHLVASAPAVVADMPPTVAIGGTAVPVQVEVSNTGLGTALTNARIDVAIEWAGPGIDPIGPDGGTPRITLSTVEGGSSTPIALTHSGEYNGQVLAGSIGGSTGFPLPPGTSDTLDLELRVAAGVSPGALAVTFTLVHVDPTTGEVLAERGRGGGEITMVEANRRDTTIVAGDPGFPGWIPEIPAITPSVVRPGATAQTYNAYLTAPSQGVVPTGSVEFLFDGKPIPVRDILAPISEPFVVQRIPLGAQIGGAGIVQLAIPVDAVPGLHHVTIRYDGDAVFNPTSATFPVTVDQPVGQSFECLQEGPAPSRWRANIDVFASIPRLARAGDLTLRDARVRLLMSRYGQNLNYFYDHVDPSNEPQLVAPVSPGGAITASSMSQTGNFGYSEDPSLGTDHAVTFHGAQLDVTLSGAPGTEVPIALESLQVTLDTTYRYVLTCEPVGGPAVVGTTRIAGTTLSVSPEGKARAGREVTLSASALPASAGAVEFLDGTTTIGVVPVDANGLAVMTTDALAAGAHTLTARFRGGVGVPATTSDPVVLEVQDAQCASTADPGHGATVRLVYLELLGRCPDVAGYAYWVERLEGGTSPAAFARSISRTSEAVGMIVDDAYQTMLGRAPDAEGRAFWVKRLQATGRYDTLLADLGGSGEFWSKAGSTNEGFVTRVYDRLLNRAPDSGGLSYWTGRLAAGTSRRALVRSLANLDEPLGRLVVEAYDDVLDRTPSSGERGQGVTFLRSTGDRSGLFAELIGRPEFSTRAQDLPNPED